MVDSIIHWIAMSTPFQRYYDDAMRVASIDAFEKAHADIRETMKDDVEVKVEERLNDRLVELLSPIDWRSVITYSDTMKKVLIKGEIIPEGRLQNLASEANLLLQSDLWGIIYETSKALAEREMFIAGDSIDFMKKGRSMLYTLDCIKKTCVKLATYAQKP